MPAAVCTLFEKNHHYGVAALINSLYLNNYRGSIYAGYKGDLPTWCAARKANPELLWEGASTLQVAEGLEVHFVPVTTEMHLTFYKPYFMLHLFKLFENEVDSIAYFDPDIVIKCKWVVFDVWMSHGAALVHEHLDLPATHPLRGEWKKVIDKMNRQPTRTLTATINGGFCGVTKQNIEFLTVWTEVIDTATKYFNLRPTRWGQAKDRTYLFFNADQDALNITAMCCESPISEIGPEGMDFIPGGITMSHALGKPKPWNKKFIRYAFKGIGPSLAEKGFWANTETPIKLYRKSFITFKRTSISIATFLNRLYKRS